MYKKNYFLLLFFVFTTGVISAQKKTAFTHADTLRGSLNEERNWWDVMRYDISITPDFKNKFTSGSNIITYKVVEADHPNRMQIDLMKPLEIDSIISDTGASLKFSREGDLYHVQTFTQTKGSRHSISIYFSGNPHEAIRAPWDGGWTFTTDKKGRPWMTVTCQGLGASVWYPNKDHQSDEPDEGASLKMTVPHELTAVANGRLIEKKQTTNGTTSYTWEVVNPISNYTIIPYIGHYAHFDGKYAGLKGNLDLDYWVLDYNLEKARDYFPSEVKHMLESFEYWFGPYPFYEDGYKLVETEHTGMEHQSAVAYGNHYAGGYRGRDASGTGIGLLWDFIIVHESGHEWFGNNITSNDLADMFLHESFTNYSETLYIDYRYGEEAANDYNFGIRSGIQNDKPIIPAYGVNAQGSGDMYPKGGNMLHTIRHSIDNDKLFRNILAGVNGEFYHKTIDADEVLDYISRKAGFDYSQVFSQYLTTTQIPELEIFRNPEGGKVHYKWTNCLEGFNLPLVLKGGGNTMKIFPTEQWKTVEVTPEEQFLFDPLRIEKMYYIKVNILKELK